MTQFTGVILHEVEYDGGNLTHFWGVLGIEDSPEGFEPLIAAFSGEHGLTTETQESGKRPSRWLLRFTFEVYGSDRRNPVKRWFGFESEASFMSRWGLDKMPSTEP